MPHDGPDRVLPTQMRIMGGVNTEVGTDQGAAVADAEENSGFDAALRERLASGVDVARAATEEFATSGVGEHLGVTVEAAFTTTHRFASELPGYRGWYWACVLALVPGGEVTVDEIALLPGDEALVAPEWVPWEKRIRPGDLGPGDLLPPAEDDERLVPGHTSSGDEALDEAAGPIGLGRPRHLSREGRSAAAERWAAERGPESEIARGAKHHCGTCGFLVPVAGSLGTMFGICANEYAADGQTVHLEYGCGAHSEVRVPGDSTPPVPEAYDDAAVDVIVLPQQLAATARARSAGADAAGETTTAESAGEATAAGSAGPSGEATTAEESAGPSGEATTAGESAPPRDEAED